MKHTDNSTRMICFLIILTAVLLNVVCHAETKSVEGKIVGIGPNKVWMNVGTEAGAAVDMIFEVWRGEEKVAKVKIKKAGKTSSEAEVLGLKEGMSCATGDMVKSTGEVKAEPKKEEPKKEEPKTEEVKPVETASTPASLTPTVTASVPSTPATPAETKKEEPKKEEIKKEEPKKETAKPKAKRRSFWSRFKIKDTLYVVLILGGTMVIQK